jgi:hypothetical protein
MSINTIYILKVKCKLEQVKFKKVRILWKDARNINTELFEAELEDLKEDRLLAPYDCVGFLIKETKDVIVIALGLMPQCDPRDETLFRHLLCIPKSQIETMEYLIDDTTIEQLRKFHEDLTKEVESKYNVGYPKDNDKEGWKLIGRKEGIAKAIVFLQEYNCGVKKA